MNQQIRQLALQAGYRPLPGFEFANSLEEVFIEKFSELIVRECVGIADEYDGVGSTIVSRIKKHFGVEE